MTFSKEKSNKSFSRNTFTLMEIVVVLVIVVLVSGIAVATVKMPVFATLDKTSKKVRKIFADAQRQTALQGSEILVVYNPERKEFNLMPPSTSEDNGDSNLIPMDPELNSVSVNPQWALRIPDQIEVEFPDYEEETIQYRFFPDGTASGPELTLTLKGRTMIVGVSRLTGMAYSREEEE